MAFPTITFSDPAAGGTGSDSNTSGAGPGTAITGTGASLTASSGSINLSADAPDLSGVDATGLHVIWVNTSGGRQSYRITGVNNTTKVVTVSTTAPETAPTVTESGRAWAIGGKRATLDGSRTLVSTDTTAGWTLSLDTDQVLATTPLTLGATLTNSGQISGSVTNGFIRLVGAGAVRSITQQANAACLDGSLAQWRLESIKLANSNGTKSAAYGINFNAAAAAGTGAVQLNGCTLGDATNKLLTGLFRTSSSTPLLFLFDVEVHDCTGAGISITSTGAMIVAIGCYVHDNGSHGIITSAVSNLVVQDSVICRNAGDGIQVGSVTPNLILIRNNTIHGNTGAGADGIDISGSSALNNSIAIFNNNLTANGTSGTGYGIRAAAGLDVAGVLVGYNNFGTGATANFTAAILNGTVASTSLQVDPQYVNAAGSNFGVGTNLKAKGFPAAARTVGNNISSTTTYVDIGAAQRQEAGGGGTYAAASDVRLGVDRGDGTTGTCRVPGVGNVKTGFAYDASDSLAGTYTGSDRWTDPGVNNVRSTIAYKADSTTNNRTGNVVLPAAADVTLSVGYGSFVGGTYEFTGSNAGGGGGGMTLAQLQSELNTRGLTSGFTAGTSGGVNVLKINGVSPFAFDGTAVAVAGTSITLDPATRPAVDVAGWTVTIRSATAGAGQTRQVTAYNTGTGVATVAAWATTPTGTVTYTMDPPVSVIDKAGYSLAALPAIPNNWITAAGINAAALNGKGDWLTTLGGTAPAGWIDANAIATDAITSGKLAPDAIGASELATGAINKIQAGLSTYAGGDTPGTGTLLTRLGTPVGASIAADIQTRSTYAGGAVASVAAPVTVGTNTDKAGYSLASSGLDAISTAAPAGVAANFREMVVQTWRRFFKKADRTPTAIRTFADNGATVLTTQAITDDGAGNETQGAAS